MPARSESSASVARRGLHPARAARGEHGHVRVAEIQRARILAAMVDVCSERGVGEVNIAHVVARSGVSRRTFYELFAGRDDCFLAAFEEGVERVAGEVAPAYERADGWRQAVRAGLVALLSFFEREPAYGRFLLVESLGMGQAVVERRSRMIASLTSVVAEGRKQRGDGAAALSPLAAEGVVGGVLVVLQERLLAFARSGSERAGLLALTNPLMSTIVLPYLGSAAARRELERPEPVENVSQNGARLLSNPFKDAGMRLTYRTARVLTAIAELGDREPGPSNRLIGQAAGISDQGQISKLLARLERTGMVSNTGLGAGQGAPNAWSLTSSGRQVIASFRGAHRSIQAQVEGAVVDR